MPLIRLFILVAVIFIVYMLIRRFRANKTTRQTPKPRREIQSTVKCRYCGTYLPKNEAIESDNGYYCSQKHQLADQG